MKDLRVFMAGRIKEERRGVQEKETEKIKLRDNKKFIKKKCAL